MTQLHKLPASAINFGLQRMNNRVLLAAILTFFAIVLMLSFAPGNLLARTQVHFELALIFEVILACASLVLAGQKLLQKRFGQVIFRSVFTSHACLYAICFSLIVRLILVDRGINVFSMSITSLLIFGATVGLTTFAFDLIACTSFLFCILTPIIYTSIFELQGGTGIAITYSLALSFFTFLGWAIHKAEVDGLYFAEQLRQQSLALGESNQALLSSNALYLETLDSIEDIILTFDRRGICFGNQVSRVSGILGFEPNGMDFSEVLQLGAQARQNAQEWFQLLVSGKIDFEIFQENGPDQLTLRESDRSFRVRYFVRHEGERMTGMIMTLQEITRELIQQQVKNSAIERANFVLAISENRAGFQRFLIDVREFLADLKFWQGQDLNQVRFKLHNFKANAGGFFVSVLSTKLNEMEMNLRQGLDEGTKIQALKSSAEHLVQMLDEWFTVEQKTFERLQLFDSDNFSVSYGHAKQIAPIFEQYPNGPELYTKALHYLLAPLVIRTLASFEKVVERVALKRGKKINFELKQEGSDFLIASDEYLRVFESFVHLFTNAADHGIEVPATRDRLGKAPVGRVSVEVKEEAASLVILIQDDGAGIDPAKIRAIAGAQGSNVESLSERDVLLTIFKPGFSTVALTNDLSGQGIGLSDLMFHINQVGGSIEVESILDQGTKFTVRLPLTMQHLVRVSSATDRAQLRTA